MSSNRQSHHQDYIARIRYSNALPPPPFAPKLLDIQNASLANGQYTSISFSSRLAREQPLNIEADAELGMPINLVGLSGVFNEDESAITFPEHLTPLDPKDRALLKPISALGKSSAASQNVTFLRRTEYITSHGNKTVDASAALRSTPRPKRTGPSKPTPAQTDRDSMCRKIEKSFNLPYPRDAYTGPDNGANGRYQGADITRDEKEAWLKPRHPTNAALTVIDEYPVLPDLAALPAGANAYMVIKYATNPSQSGSERYDPRLDYLLLQPRDPTEEQQAKFKRDQEDYAAGKLKHAPLPGNDFTAYIPDGKDSTEVVSKLKRKYDVFDFEAESDDLYTVTEGATPHFAFSKLRAYETAYRVGSVDTMWDESVVMSLQDVEEEGGEGGRFKRQRAAYLYPIIQRCSLRQQRMQTDRMGRMIKTEVLDADVPDVLEVTVGDMADEDAVGEIDDAEGEYE